MHAVEIILYSNFATTSDDQEKKQWEQTYLGITILYKIL